jgi:hypothetical protein
MYGCFERESRRDGAVAMHVKVSDPLMKSVPALSVLVLSLVIALGNGI